MKRILLLFVIWTACQFLSFAQTTQTSSMARGANKESYMLLSYYHSFGNVVYPSDRGATNGIVLSYLRDYTINNTPFFLGFGGSLGYGYYLDARDNCYLNTFYVGIPLSVGIKSTLSNRVQIKPFFRIMPFLDYHFGYFPSNDDRHSKFSFGGVVPELGVALNISRIVLSLSYGFSWNTDKVWIGYSRLGEHGIYFVVGYKF